MRHRMILRLLGVAAVASMALPAASSGSVKTRSATTSVAGGIASATAQCPRSERATGGGFLHDTGPPPELLVYENRKVGQRRWRASGQLLAAVPASRSITAYVICRRGQPNTEAISEFQNHVTQPAIFRDYSTSAKCETGRARAGGFVFTPPVLPPGNVSHASIGGSHRVGTKSWRTTVHSSNGWASFGITTYVYCAGGSKARERVSTQTGPGGGVQLFVDSPNCPTGRRAVAGGFLAPVGAGAAHHNIHGSLRSGRHWQTLSRSSSGGPSTVSSYVYCL